jgi:superfamily II DNA/RNA helicase
VSCTCYNSYFQVCDHLKDAAKFLGIHVVPIVGGLSMEKQERLLKKKPEIVVGTPGRLWELMSSGNEHLVEVSVRTSESICQVVNLHCGNSLYD